jgi:hypothetical protein
LVGPVWVTDFLELTEKENREIIMQRALEKALISGTNIGTEWPMFLGVQEV